MVGVHKNDMWVGHTQHVRTNRGGERELETCVPKAELLGKDVTSSGGFHQLKEDIIYMTFLCDIFHKIGT